MFIYLPQAITAYHFNSTDPQSAVYNEGASWVGILIAAYNGVAVLVVFLLPLMAKKVGRVSTHVVCLFIGGLGFISMIGVGIAWASILTMPYAILSSAVPHRKMGVYMGMFNLFVVIPQILASAVLGLLLRTQFQGHAIYTIVLGGVAMIVAGLAMLFVKEPIKKVE